MQNVLAKEDGEFVLDQLNCSGQGGARINKPTIIKMSREVRARIHVCIIWRHTKARCTEGARVFCDCFSRHIAGSIVDQRGVTFPFYVPGMIIFEQNSVNGLFNFINLSMVK